MTHFPEGYEDSPYEDSGYEGSPYGDPGYEDWGPEWPERKEEEPDPEQDGCGCSGCLGMSVGCLLYALLFFFLWALIFGVTLGDDSYSMGCLTIEDGVRFDRE